MNSKCRPADVMRALHLYLSGKSEQAMHWAPELAASSAACVRRTADLLAFYECIALSSGGPGSKVPIWAIYRKTYPLEGCQSHPDGFCLTCIKFVPVCELMQNSCCQYQVLPH